MRIHADPCGSGSETLIHYQFCGSGYSSGIFSGSRSDQKRAGSAELNPLVPVITFAITNPVKFFPFFQNSQLLFSTNEIFSKKSSNKFLNFII